MNETEELVISTIGAGHLLRITKHFKKNNTLTRNRFIEMIKETTDEIEQKLKEEFDG